MTRPYNVLFLCTGNSARSILAEAILNKDGSGRFNAFSAGSFPKGQVHPEALRMLDGLGYRTGNSGRRAGTSSPKRVHRRSISSSPFAIMRRAKPARFGRASR